MQKLSSVQLKNLENYQHQISGVSLLQHPFQLFWNLISKFLSQWFAPSAITSFGLSINLTTSILLIYYCPTATETAPSWLYAVNGAGIISFQAFHAFNRPHTCFSQTLSAFNELFNHGCQSVSYVFIVLGACASLQLGNYPWIMTLLCLTAYATFYCWLWCAYVTGVFYVFKFHVIEVQFFTVFLYGVDFLFGSTVWIQPIPMFYFPLHVIPVSLVIVGFVNAIIHYLKIIVGGGCGDNGATVADTSVISPIFVIGIIVASAVSIASQSIQLLCQGHPVLYLFLIGLLCVKVTNCLLVCQVTKHEFQIFDSSMLGLLALFLNQHFNSILDEYLLLWLCMAYTLFDLLYYLFLVYVQVASHMKVKSFFFVVTPEHHFKTD